MDPNKIRTAEKKKLVENLLLITGFTKSGKFTFANLVDAIEDVEHYHYKPLLEHLAALVKLNLIDVSLAKTMIQMEVDNAGYDMMVGREINFRYSDRSSIYKSPKLKEYIQRGLDPDGDKAVEKMKSKERYYSHIGHEIFPSIEMFLELYPKIKVLHLERHPVDLAYVWNLNEWGRRFAQDVKDFSLPFQGINMPVPWFAAEWAQVYEDSNETDRVIRSIYHVVQMNKEVWLRLSEESKSKIHKVCFEKVLTDTDAEMKKVAAFLGKEMMPEMRLVVVREGLPGDNPGMDRSQRLKFIEENCSPECFKMLLEMKEEYEGRWQVA